MFPRDPCHGQKIAETVDGHREWYIFHAGVGAAGGWLLADHKNESGLTGEEQVNMWSPSPRPVPPAAEVSRSLFAGMKCPVCEHNLFGHSSAVVSSIDSDLLRRNMVAFMHEHCR